MRLCGQKMKCRSIAIQFLIPLSIILYTVTMVLIQLGIPDKKLILENLDKSFPNDLYSQRKHEYNEVNFIGRKSAFQFHKKPNFLQMKKVTSNRDPMQTIYNKKDSSFIKVGNISVFSVYLDNRLSIIPKIRIIALKQTLSEENLICHFEFKRKWLTVIADHYEMCENHGRFYGGWIYSCKVPPQLILKMSTKLFSILLTSTFALNENIRFNITSETMSYRDKQMWRSGSSQVHQPIMQQSKKNFGMCLPPLFGDISLSLLIQFIELSKILGASHLTFYAHNTTDSVSKILSYYQREGEVTVVKWKLPSEVSEREIWYHGQILAIQDCLYRNMEKYEYLIFVDIDEFIIPRNAMTWTEMLNSNINSKHSSDLIAGYSFKSAFFDPKQMPETSQQLTFLQLLQRNAVYSSVRTKLMVRPEKVFELGIHHVSKLMDPNLTVIDVDINTAIIHHYRPCIINYEPNMKCYRSVRDESLLKYEEILVERYKDIVRKTIELFVPMSGFNSN